MYKAESVLSNFAKVAAGKKLLTIRLPINQIKFSLGLTRKMK